MIPFKKIHTILYVENQEISSAFYEEIFEKKTSLKVSGMTEFELNESFTLGLMPNDGIKKIIENKMPNPNLGKGIPRCELYFYIEK